MNFSQQKEAIIKRFSFLKELNQFRFTIPKEQEIEFTFTDTKTKIDYTLHIPLSSKQHVSFEAWKYGLELVEEENYAPWFVEVCGKVLSIHQNQQKLHSLLTHKELL